MMEVVQNVLILPPYVWQSVSSMQTTQNAYQALTTAQLNTSMMEQRKSALMTLLNAQLVISMMKLMQNVFLTPFLYRWILVIFSDQAVFRLPDYS